MSNVNEEVTVVSVPWKNERYFASYSEANELKNDLKAHDRSGILQLKIKRCGEGGSMYVVKSRQDPKAQAELEAIEQKLLSKKKTKKSGDA